MKNQYDPRVASLEQKHLATESMSEEDVQVAQDALKSSNVIERIIACEAVLRCPGSEQLREQAVTELNTLCVTALSEPQATDARLAWGLSLLPRNFLQSQPTLRGFVLHASQKGDASCRMNAMVALERLAQAGDLDALGTLRRATDDPDERVRRNAVNFLKRMNLNDA